MIRDLRKKFILVAMLSTLVVLTAIMGVINISNYKEMLDRADDMTALLIQNDGQFPEEPVDEDSEIPDKPDNTKRTKSGTDTQTPPEKPQGDREHYSVETPFEMKFEKYVSVASNFASPFKYSNKYLMTHPPITE